MSQIDDEIETEYSSDVDKSLMSRKFVSETQETEYGSGPRAGEKRKHKSKGDMELTEKVLDDTDRSDEGETAEPFKMGKVDDREDLIKWATRLELESLSLKELVRSGVGHMLRQGGIGGGGGNQGELTEMLGTVQRSLQQLAKQQRETGKKQGKSQIESQLESRLDDLMKKLDKIEEEISRNRKEDLPNALGESKTSSNTSIDGVTGNFIRKSDFVELEEKMRQHCAYLAKLVEEIPQKYDSSSRGYDQKLRKFISEATERVHKQVGTKIVIHGKKMESLIDTAQNRATDHISNACGEVQQEISKFNQLEDIKTFLSLLVPRIVGLEESIAKLRSNYDILIDNTKKDTEEDLQSDVKYKTRPIPRDQNHGDHKRSKLA